MKYLLLILAIFSGVNNGLAQHNSSFDRAKEFQLNLKPSSNTIDFISEPLSFPFQSEISFFTIAVYSNAPFSGNLQYKLDNQAWKPLRPLGNFPYPIQI